MKTLLNVLAVAVLVSTAAYADTGPTVPANINCKDIAAAAAKAAANKAGDQGTTNPDGTPVVPAK